MSASHAVVGEEYPPFGGNPEMLRRATRRSSVSWADVARSAGSWPERYVVGMTPGWHLASGLGGNVNRWPRSEVNRWRAKYVDERARIGAFGFGAYHFRFEKLGASDGTQSPALPEV